MSNVKQRNSPHTNHVSIMTSKGDIESDLQKVQLAT